MNRDDLPPQLSEQSERDADEHIRSLMTRVDPDIGELMQWLRREYAIYAGRNAKRLDIITAGYERLDRWVKVVLGLLLALQIAFATAIVVLDLDHSADRAAERVQMRASVQGCTRLEILAASGNSNSYGDFVLLKAEIAQEKAKGVDVTPFQRAVQGYTWVPLTRCASLVAREGTSYRLERAVHFSSRLPPPSALMPPPPPLSGP